MSLDQYELTPRQRQIAEAVLAGKPATEIASDLGITRNAVYQQIGKLRKDGVLPANGGGTTARPTPRAVAPAAEPPAITDDTVDQFLSQCKARLVHLEEEEARIGQEKGRLLDVVQRLEPIVTTSDETE